MGLQHEPPEPLDATKYKHSKKIFMATKKLTLSAEFKNISLKDIVADKNQPRKFFDEHSLAELSASVKANGVLQPIMVRPNGKKFLLVYGERRYKAALAAELKEIPAIVRELTDAEALDIQITENLQRKDVHPMEEAVAFKKLSDNLSIEDIALRIGKSESFVAKRIQLTELVEDAQQVFFLNKITISEAIKLARLDKAVQQEIMNEVLPENWKDEETFELERDVENYIKDQELDLSKAIFKLHEKMLYREAGACIGCKFNSASTPLLFDEEESKKSICSKPSCFQIKTQRQEKKNMETLAADPSKLVVLTQRKDWLTAQQKAKVQLAEETGINLITEDCYKKVEAPEDLMSYSEWVEDEYYDGYDQDLDEEELAGLKNEYDDYVENHKKEIAEYEAVKLSGKAKIAFDILNHKEVFVLIEEKAQKEVEQTTGNAGHDETKEEIAKIESREARAKELDAEKVWEKVRALLNDENVRKAIYLPNTLTKIETQALGVALYTSLGYHTRRLAEAMLEMDTQKERTDYKYSISDINMLERIFIMEKLVNAFGSHVSNGQNKLAYDVLNQYLSNEILKIELEQKGIADARAERVNKRVSALKKKLIMN
jgi:ParB/RepB/Spo0J family partition protein